MRWADCAMLRFASGIEPRFNLLDDLAPSPLDMNCDGQVTIGDVPAVAAYLFHVPGDALVRPFLIPELVSYLQLSGYYGTFLSTFLSVRIWSGLLAI